MKEVNGTTVISLDLKSSMELTQNEISGFETCNEFKDKLIYKLGQKFSSPRTIESDKRVKQ